MGKSGYSLQEKIRLKEGFRPRRIMNQDVLVSVGENIVDFNGYIELNASAAVLCKALKEACTVEQLAKELEQQFQIPYAQAEEDVLEFVQILKEKDMVIVS